MLKFESYFSSKRLSRRKGGSKAIVAASAKLLKVVF
jgi:hypothetical protein